MDGQGYGADEDIQLARRLPHAVLGVGSDRSSVGNRILSSPENLNRPLQEQVAVSIMDDGLQHFALDRNVNCAMFNALDPWGNGHVLPKGRRGQGEFSGS